MTNIWLLLVIFQLKHFIADYPLQGKYMLGKFKERDWVLPLMAHAGVHLVFTFAIAFFVLGDWYTALTIGMLDFNIHFLMDRIKASPYFLGQFKPLYGQEYMNAVQTNDVKKLRGNTYFWWSLGLDQMVHGLTDLLCAFLIIMSI